MWFSGMPFGRLAESAGSRGGEPGLGARKNYPAVNQLLTLVVAGGGEYPTRVEGYRGPDIVLALPIVQGMLLSLKPGTRVRAAYQDDTATYHFDSVVSSLEEKPLPLLIVSGPVEIKRIQRRRYVRFEVALPVRFGIVGGPEESAAGTLPIHRGTTRDISGGGILLVTGIRLDPGTELYVELELPGQEKVGAYGQAMRIYRTVENGPRTEHWIGVAFRCIAERERNRIVNFIFEQQRILRQRGLL